jgi:hypothetical protein
MVRAMAGALKSEHSDTTFAIIEFVKDDQAKRAADMLDLPRVIGLNADAPEQNRRYHRW